MKELEDRIRRLENELESTRSELIRAQEPRFKHSMITIASGLLAFCAIGAGSTTIQSFFAGVLGLNPGDFSWLLLQCAIWWPTVYWFIAVNHAASRKGTKAPTSLGDGAGTHFFRD